MKKEIIINYLLAWRWWSEGIQEWHGLKNENLFLYSNASEELGHIPSVLYSTARVLNTIGSNFKDEGIDWVHTIVVNNSSLNLDDLESKTMFYLEKFLRKYIFINRQKIKEEIRLKLGLHIYTKHYIRNFPFLMAGLMYLGKMVIL